MMMMMLETVLISRDNRGDNQDPEDSGGNYLRYQNIRNVSSTFHYKSYDQNHVQLWSVVSLVSVLYLPLYLMS